MSKSNMFVVVCALLAPTTHAMARVPTAPLCTSENLDDWDGDDDYDLADARLEFVSRDENGDNLVTLEEWLAYMIEKYMPDGGPLSFPDYVAARSQGYPGDMHPEGCQPTIQQLAILQQKFDTHFDTNGDGLATKGEMVAAMTLVYENMYEGDWTWANVKDAEQATIAEADSNGDGHVTPTEQKAH